MLPFDGGEVGMLISESRIHPDSGRELDGLLEFLKPLKKSPLQLLGSDQILGMVPLYGV